MCTIASLSGFSRPSRSMTSKAKLKLSAFLKEISFRLPLPSSETLMKFSQMRCSPVTRLAVMTGASSGTTGVSSPGLSTMA